MRLDWTFLQLIGYISVRGICWIPLITENYHDESSKLMFNPIDLDAGGENAAVTIADNCDPVFVGWIYNP